MNLKKFEHVFIDNSECKDFIYSVPLGTYLILSVSEQMANRIIADVHHLSQIKAIFICQDTPTSEHEAFGYTNYSKVRYDSFILLSIIEGFTG